MNPAEAYYYYPVTQASKMESSMIDQTFLVLDKYGVSFFTVLCSFWFILYLTKSAAKERETFWQRDAENDNKLIQLVQNSSDALLQVKVALEQNTQAMREYIRYKRD